MPVTVVCSSCKAKLKAPDALVGKAVKCPGCGSAVMVKAVAADSPAAAPRAGSGPSPKVPAPAKSTPPPPKPQPAVDELDDVEEVEEEPVQSITKPKGKKAPPPAAEGPEPERGPVSDNDKLMGLLLYLSGFVVGIIGPAILWLVKRKDSPFIDHHGKQFFNFMLTLFAVMVVVLVLLGALGGLLIALDFKVLAVIAFILMGVAAGCLSLYSTVMVLIAAFKAKAGAWFRFPMTIRLFK